VRRVAILRVLLSDLPETLIARVTQFDLIGFLSAAQNIPLVHDLLIAAHACDVATADIRRVGVVVDAHD
jgi:hypothetical protein